MGEARQKQEGQGQDLKQDNGWHLANASCEPWADQHRSDSHDLSQGYKDAYHSKRNIEPVCKVQIEIGDNQSGADAHQELGCRELQHDRPVPGSSGGRGCCWFR
ncbi:hypothetical protein D3C73_1337590 [compost metagenome]